MLVRALESKKPPVIFGPSNVLANKSPPFETELAPENWTGR
jgi:hypothetical protein